MKKDVTVIKNDLMKREVSRVKNDMNHIHSKILHLSKKLTRLGLSDHQRDMKKAMEECHNVQFYLDRALTWYELEKEKENGKD